MSVELEARTTAKFQAAIDLSHLSPAAELAVLARALHRVGYDDYTAGHITCKQPDGTFLTNPYPLLWDEFSASDVIRIDLDGNVLEGDWPVTQAIMLHLELHRARNDVTVAVHNHPRWATIWAAAHEVPPVYDNGGAFCSGEVAFLPEYSDTVRDPDFARRNVEAIGDSNCAILANHGVFVLAPSVMVAFLRSAAIERRCELAWHVRAMGTTGRPMDPVMAEKLALMAESGEANGPWYWEAAARRELRLDPGITG
jgi:L-fuculose-phosphate aldolase